MNKVEAVRDELDRRHDMLGGEFPGQLDAVKRICGEFPNLDVGRIADKVQESLPQYFPQPCR